MGNSSSNKGSKSSSALCCMSDPSSPSSSHERRKRLGSSHEVESRSKATSNSEWRGSKHSRGSSKNPEALEILSEPANLESEEELQNIAQVRTSSSRALQSVISDSSVPNVVPNGIHKKSSVRFSEVDAADTGSGGVPPSLIKVATVPDDEWTVGTGTAHSQDPLSVGSYAGHPAQAAAVKKARESILLLHNELKRDEAFNASGMGTHLDMAMEDTTSAFLELLQLDKMSAHLKQMRERRIFLEYAAYDESVPIEEREVALWLKNTYLRRTPSSYEHSTHRKHGAHCAQLKDRTSKKKDLEHPFHDPAIDNIIRSPNVAKILDGCNSWDFDSFAFVDECGIAAVPILLLTVCENRGLLDALDVPPSEFFRFGTVLSENYKDNPYHNRMHGCDVTCSMNYFMRSAAFNQVDDLDKFAILIAACAHDVGHPGNNNLYEINTESELAITYNDQSVLENFHIALTWRLLCNTQDGDMLKNFSREARRRFREVLVNAILATDMSQHSVHSETLDQLVSKKGTEDEEFADKFLPVALHTADLANPAKRLELYEEWVERLMREFFGQGDRERDQGLPISNLCDRFKVNVHSGQVGFINFVIRPWWKKWGELLDEEEQGALFMSIMEENFAAMQAKANLIKDDDSPVPQPAAPPPAMPSVEPLVVEVSSLGDDHFSDERHTPVASIESIGQLQVVSDDKANLGKPQIIDIPSYSPDDGAPPRRESRTFSGVFGQEDALAAGDNVRQRNHVVDEEKDGVGPLPQITAVDTEAAESSESREKSRSVKNFSIVAMSLEEIHQKLGDDFGGKEESTQHQIHAFLRKASRTGVVDT